MTLPRALDELTGLRAARWLRESTPGQLDNFGPDAQREQQDRAIERYGLVDIGLTYDVAHSGRTIGATPQFGAMVAAAGTVFDILVVGYVSRFARDLRTAVNARHEIHQRGAALLFADERILSSDVEAWELWAREAVEAEAYSRRLAKRISEGYAAKFRRHADQAGSAPLGFQRTPERPHLLEVDPTTIRRVVDLFHRYATDTVSLTALAEEAGLSEPALRVILANPIYNGWVRRHRRGRDEERAPAPWRSAPPIDDALWARVAEVRRARWTGGGRPTRRHDHLLAGRLFCASCGTRVRAEATTKRRRWTFRRYRHRDRCSAWQQATYAAAVFEAPILEQVRQARFSPAHVASLRRLAAAGTARPDGTDLRRRQLERDLAARAAAHAARRLSTEAYLAEHRRLTAELDRLAAEPSRDAAGIDPDIAAARLADWQDTLRTADAATAAALVGAIYERIEVSGRTDRLRVVLTSEAEAHGLALALPTTVAGARPAGFEPATI